MSTSSSSHHQQVSVLLSITDALNLPSTVWDFSSFSSVSPHSPPLTSLSSICGVSSQVLCDSTNSTIIGINLSSNPLFHGVTVSSFNPLQALPDLESLELHSNDLVGSLPSEWGATMKKLSYLDVCPNALSGVLPVEWSGMSSLTVFYGCYNDFVGTLPSEWGTLVLLRQLDLAGNGLTGPLPSSWSNIQDIQWLYLDDNKLSGNLPEEWGAFTQMEWFGASSNSLGGTLPTSFGAWTSIQGLYLSSNTFSGPLPKDYAAFSSLVTFDVSDNKLEGGIPFELTSMSSLQQCNFSSNAFTSGLESMLLIASLELMDVSGNALEGPLSFIRDAGDSMTNLILSRNRFEPHVLPSVFALKSQTRSSALLVDMRGMEFDCPFPSPDVISREASSWTRVLHDSCHSNYQIFLLDYCLPIFGALVALFLIWKFASLLQHGVARAITKPLKRRNDVYSWSSHKRLKAIRLFLFGFMLYGNVNDIEVYKHMLDVLDYATLQNPCEAVNNRVCFTLNCLGDGLIMTRIKARTPTSSAPPLRSRATAAIQTSQTSRPIST